MVELIRRLDRETFDIHVACFHRRGPLEAALTAHVSSIAAFPIQGFARVATARQMLRFASWCRQIGARVVQTCELYANIFGLPAAALAGVDVRIGSRRELVTQDKTKVQLAFQRLSYKLAHAVVANSGAAAAQLRREGVPARKIQTIANGVDYAAFAAAPRNSGRPIRRVVTVANLRREKAHDTLIAAAARVVKQVPNAEFVFVGNGPMLAELQQQVADRGLIKHVQFLGERSDVAPLLESSDVFVLPSLSEACPNAVLEAMASGLPVIASRVGGLPELIVSGQHGVLVEPNQPEALAAAILDLMKQPDVAALMGLAARDRASRQFSFDRMVSQFEHLYLSQLDGRAARPAPGPELAAS
jgi:glycosyltransferase involved in cell wall biosynthesis